MSFELIPFASGMIQKQAVNEVVKCNDLTARFGLVLTQAQAAELVETRAVSLLDNGRVEFGGGVIDKLIREFCDSPFISAANYADTLHELIEAFYYYKNESLDLITDDDLIKFMKSAFDGACRGSLELLTHRELERLSRNLRFGLSAEYSGEDISDAQEEDDE